MPTPFVGLHLALATVVALFGLPFILDPCGGGGDFCVGGVVGLAALGAAGIVLVGLGIRAVAKRASPLLVLDSAIAAVAWSIVAIGSDVRVPLLLLGAQTALALAAFGAVASGRAVITHRIEPIVTVIALVALGVWERFEGVELVVAGVLALVLGWLVNRFARGAPAPAQPPAQAG